jgi:hypothetical protein
VPNQPYTRNHVASVCYLNGWTDAGRVQAVRLRARLSAAVAPESTGYRKKFWGADDDLRGQAEGIASRIESEAGPVIAALPNTWPLRRGSVAWFAMVKFLALHVVRTPAFRRDIVQRSESLLQANQADHVATFGDAYPEFLERVRSDFYVADLMVSNIPKIATLLGSAHWTLLTTSDPILGTSDQPVVPVPIVGPQAAAEITATPAGGFALTTEFRIAIDPRHALLLTWLDDADNIRDIATIGHRDACALNWSVAAQADAECFHHPQGSMPTVCPPFAGPDSYPLGPSVHPGYDDDAAMRSSRRTQAAHRVDHMIENEISNVIETLSVTRQEAA